MKITKRQLKRIIKEEMSALQIPSLSIGSVDVAGPIEIEPQAMESDSGGMMGKAKACCVMQGCDLFDMCAELCETNPGMTAACAELCACVCDHDIYGVCSCLEELCSCPECTAIITRCCGC